MAKVTHDLKFFRQEHLLLLRASLYPLLPLNEPTGSTIRRSFVARLGDLRGGTGGYWFSLVSAPPLPAALALERVTARRTIDFVALRSPPYRYLRSCSPKR